MSETTHPLRVIRSTGRVDLIGEYDTQARVLRIAAPGFPLLGPGDHPVDGDLPWVFQDMAPGGFVARRFAKWFPELGLPADHRRWSVADTLRALTDAGHDLVGSLVVGAGSFERYERIFGMPEPGPRRERARDLYRFFVRDILVLPENSPVGGERPKFTLRLADGQGLIVKFTPPLDSTMGRRWADLLRMEFHAAATLRAHEVPAADCSFVEQEDRGYLEIERFDRLAGGGRMGAVTLSWLGGAEFGELTSPTVVLEGLLQRGLVGSEMVERVRRLHAFSSAIGNTDAHLGNYALVIDDEGRVSLAPAYDILPMVFAPRSDELPDAHIPPVFPRPEPSVAGWVRSLAARVEADAGISTAFRDAWLSRLQVD